MNSRDDSIERFETYLRPFAAYPRITACVVCVLRALPADILEDFLIDARFTVALDDFSPERGRRVWMACPGPIGDESRSVILKPRLEAAGDHFARYIIAHEFAHAYLRNGGWGAISDREEAADALAAHWGFPSSPNPFL